MFDIENLDVFVVSFTIIYQIEILICFNLKILFFE